MRNIISLLFIIICISNVNAQIFINEFQPANSTTIKDPDYGKNSDWIELYNTSDTEVDITGFSLSDNLKGVSEWNFPDGTLIPAKGYLLVWADNETEGGLHANFSISNNGDEVALFDNNGNLIDAINTGAIADNLSFARRGDGGNVWGISNTPTPASANNTDLQKMQAPEAVFNIKGGFYDDMQSVEISSFIDNGEVRYTTDGSMPMNSSEKYTAPIQVKSNTVIKAKVFHPDYNEGRLTMHTYFIGERMSTFPVVSLGVDPYNFFDETTGMYMTGPNADIYEPYYGANYWDEERELPVTFEYFVDGKREVDVNAGIKIFGGWSRRFAQKSFSINCRRAYGDERMRYKFFENKDINVFKQILLRNSGSLPNEVRYRDMMLQQMVKDQMDIDYQEGHPAIVYINGEYWGILNIREKLSERYLKDNYGLDQDKVNLLANYHEILHGTDEGFWQMHDNIGRTSYKSESSYSKIDKMIDVDEFMNYNIAQIFFGNHDWPGGNIKYWNTTDADSKWRWILFDTDQSFAYYNYCHYSVNTLYDATNVIMKPGYWSSDENGVLFLSRFLENPIFRDEFIQRFCAHINSTFATERTTGFIQEYEALYAPEKPYHLERWETSDTLWYWNVIGMMEFAEERPAYMFSFIQDYFNLSSPSELTIESANNNSPQYEIKGVPSSGQNYKGQFFNNIPITIKALPASGKHFDHWEDQSGNLISNKDEIEINLTGNRTITAVYADVEQIKNIYINEFMASNSSSYADSRGEYDDWIELYNDNNYAVELGGLFITDNISDTSACQIPVGQNGETVIPAKGYIVLWADSDENQGPLHINMKLNANGEEIGLFQKNDAGINWLDSVHFQAQTDNASLSRYGDGYGEFVFESAPTPNAKNKGTPVTAYEEKKLNALLFPSVTNKNITVLLENAVNAKIEIYSIHGNKVFEHRINQNSESYNLSALSEGIYFAIIHNGSQRTKQQIIIEK